MSVTTTITIVIFILLSTEIIISALSQGKDRYGANLLRIANKPIGELLKSIPATDCSTIIFSDESISQDTMHEIRNTWETPQGLAVFEVFPPDAQQPNNKNESLISSLVKKARKLRQSSVFVVVIVVSENISVLESFAELSLQERLLKWYTRLLVVSLLHFQEVNRLLRHYWTFSMMNAMFLNIEVHPQEMRYDLYSHLPYTSEGAQVIKVATWTELQGILLTNNIGVFPEKFENFHLAVVNVTALPFPPYWIEKKSEENSAITTYSGTDYFLLDAIAYTLNFTIRVLPTNNWVEVAQKVEERESFMATVFHNVLPQRLERYDFSFVYEYGALDFSFSKPQVTPQWQSIYYPLAHTVWIATLMALLFMPNVFYAVSFCLKGSAGIRGLSFITCFQDMFGMLLGQNLPRHHPKTHSSRFILTTWMVFAFIIASAYRGNLIAFLTLPSFPLRPETLKELVGVADRITMPPYGAEFKDFFGKSDSIVFTTLSQLMHIVPTVSEGQQQALEKKQGHLDTRRYQELHIAQKFTKADGSTRLYIGRESIIPGQSAWPIPHDAPYTEVLDRGIMAVIEGGLYEKWNDDLLRETRSESRQRLQKELKAKRDKEMTGQETKDVTSEEEENKSTKALTLVHMQGVIFLLGLGLFIAFMIFAGEILFNVMAKK